MFLKVDNLKRHPSQIYEAFLEGLVLFFIMLFFVNKKYLMKPGLISSLFLIFYSIFRFIAEFYREPDEQLGLLFLDLTMSKFQKIKLLVKKTREWLLHILGFVTKD